MLLEMLYEVGVNGKMWRLLKSWYDGELCQVKGVYLYYGSIEVFRFQSGSRY